MEPSLGEVFWRPGICYFVQHSLAFPISFIHIGETVFFLSLSSKLNF